jgi:hypothetical protein
MNSKVGQLTSPILQTALRLFVLLLSLRMVHPAASLWHYEFIAHLLQGLYKNTYKLRSWLKTPFQDKNANKLRSLREPSGKRLANFVRPQESLPRTTKNKPAHCCMLIIDGTKHVSRTLKCYLRRSWSRDLKTPRLIPWCEHASAEPIERPVCSSAEATSAGQW